MSNMFVAGVSGRCRGDVVLGCIAVMLLQVCDQAECIRVDDFELLAYVLVKVIYTLQRGKDPSTLYPFPSVSDRPEAKAVGTLGLSEAAAISQLPRTIGKELMHRSTTAVGRKRLPLCP
ncbi:hypothetical protein [Pelagicoccus sp. SDUM812002]|uniref:hypothetical protein n=1 Tax=Pelagicoccus sp. SDUM812002 TaxID=3041266 RepID=UPI0028104F4D|nr:hypothetical protein [Pelagicoccus sp. SDUM812002]MDQ8184118.1 hypothetical protein [Pelagicoccus sp. SDUM812002]